MYTIQSMVSFEAAHRLYGVDTYSKECSDSIHGHSYKCHITVGRLEKNSAGMVMDFKLFKKICKEVIEDRYDHSTILRDVDPMVEAFRQFAPEQKLNIVKDNPTAEWMAEEYCKELEKALQEVDEDLIVCRVSVQETENNIATYEPVSIDFVRDSQYEIRQQLQSQFCVEVNNGGAIPV